MPTASEESVLKAAQSVCDAEGHGAKVSEVSVDYETFCLRLAVPRPPGMPDAAWWEMVNDIKRKLYDIPLVSRVESAP